MTSILLSYLKETLTGFEQAVKTLEAQASKVSMLEDPNSSAMGEPDPNATVVDQNVLRMKAGHKLLSDVYYTIHNQVKRSK